MSQIALAACALVACLAFGSSVEVRAASDLQVVNIMLQDQSTDPAIKGMVLKSDTTHVKAGRVSFQAVNASKSLVHEVVVVPAASAGKDLPYNAKREAVDEKQAHAIGEVGDLKPGARGKVTLTLKPGNYLLICNQPGHYHAGMSTALAVDK